MDNSSQPYHLPFDLESEGTEQQEASPISSTDEKQQQEQNVTWRERLSHFTWAWFTVTMSTSGIAIVLHVTPHQFPGLITIGTIIFVFDLVCFVLFCAAMTARFIIAPQKFAKSFVHPSECFFFGAFWLSVANTISCTALYGIPKCGPWLVVAVRVVFWIYAACTLSNCVLQYFFFMTHTPMKVHMMTPAWFLPLLGAMLTGTVASIIASSQPPEQRLPIIIAGCAFQGLGWTVSIFLLTHMFGRLLQNGLPEPDLRPGMFIAVAAPSFTAVALMGQAQAIPTGYAYFGTHPAAVEILQTLALFVSIFLWIVMFWLFMLAALSCLASIRTMGFKMPWWSLIFPNVGFTIATIDIGNELNSPAIQWVGSAMTIMVTGFWLFDLAACAKAVWTRRILWPGQDEDAGMEKDD